MLYRIIQLLRAMFDALFMKLEHPHTLLRSHYEELQGELIEMRQLVAQAMAEAVQLERQMSKAVGQEKESLQARLTEHRATMQKLKQRLRDIEQEVQETYTKQQVLIARYKASGAFNPDLRNSGLQLVLFMLLIWGAIGVALRLKQVF